MNKKQWTGVFALVRDAVENGSHAVEKVQKDTAKLPFAVLDVIPAVAPIARIAHVVFDASVTATHGSVRLVTRAAAAVAIAAIESTGDDGAPATSAPRGEETNAD